jgi:Zn-dependent protease
MRAARVARVAGIDIRVHPLMVLLVAAVLAASVTDEGGGLWAGATWIVLVFSCVLVHELAHSVVARRRGVTVRDIVLLPIGGVSEMERLPERPADELVIASAGPLTSVAIALVAAGAALVAGEPLVPVDLLEGPLLHRLVWFNAVLGAFNLLPAFPMDGGRVLRAGLALRWPLERATGLAARVGRALAVVMAAAGIAFDLWLVLIALFVYLGASAEEIATRAHVRFAGRRVAEIMAPGPLCLPAGLPVADARRRLQGSGERHVAVVDRSGAYLGMVAVHDLRRSGAGTVGALARPVRPLAPGQDLEEAAATLAETGADAAPVLDAGVVVGILRFDDLTARLARR